MYACFIRKPDSCCANTCARNVVGTAFRKKIAHHVLHHQPDNYWTGPRGPAPTSACSVRRSINDRDKWVCVAFWVCSPWPSALGQYALKQPAPKPSHLACGSITL